jgi:sialate O-acetylesterase
MRKILTFLIFIIVCLSPIYAQSKVRFASIFSDCMVLQQNSKVALWGYAKPEENLTLKCSWINSKIQVAADKDGKWSVSVNTPSGSFNSETISLSDANNESLILNDILIGEVWLCSGQSNMEMVLMNQPQWNLFVEHSEEEIASANNTNIRFVNIQRKESFVPVEEVITNGWKVCNSDNVKWLSAVGYFYAKELFKNLNVPIGLIVSSYGGSPVQSWIAGDVAYSKSLYKKEQDKRDIEIEASRQSESEHLKAMSEWLSESEKNGFKTEEVKLSLPVNIEKATVGNHFGQFTLSKEIMASGDENLHFNLGTMDDYGQVFFNGEKVWEELRNSKSYSNVEFDIPAEKVKKGSNLIEARIINVLWGGGLTGPDMFYTEGSQSSRKSLKGNWTFSKGFDLKNVKPVPREGKPLFYTLSALYNGMISPIINYKIKGCIFYQGEENVGDAIRYPEMFKDMINCWRKVFNENLPFYYVQIAPYAYGGGQLYKAAELREAQATIEKNVPNTGMVSTIDLGNPQNIHPAQKMEVGVRLAKIALAKTYKKKIAFRFPELMNAKLKGNLVVLTFANVYKGLTVKGVCNEFELSEDGFFYKKAQISVSGNKISIMFDNSLKPKYVRYCWDDAANGTIYNSEGFPLSSFRAEIK